MNLFYNWTSSYGLAIILLTLAFRIIILPLNIKQIRNTQAMNALIPEQKKIEKIYKEDKEKLSQATMELYKKYNVSLFSGCLPMLIQLPILIAMFSVIQQTSNFTSTMFLGIDLAVPDKLFGITGLLPILAGITTYIQSVQTSSTSTSNQASNGTLTTMNKLMPLMIVIFSSTMAAGLALYWFVGNVLSIGQNYIISRYFVNLPNTAEII
ncbi:membrane protein insertase YidC [Alkalicella caledoniensis]|uniref:Membrane protein insertase YidC n=1 Tax=Alkalicella caledoniensis TaxID=2731377 RepID=A0A7G9W5I1_ALKCA|nr:YidC/Oxa1 family membrane protein insertase [Alkalicella caledoniensis]QNO13943.1 membrane protein insertase YidC [Alkalicella caledoniensis]